MRKMVLTELHYTKYAMYIYTRTEQHSSLHSLQCIPATVLPGVSPTSQLIHSTMQQRPLQAHKLSELSFTYKHCDKNTRDNSVRTP